MKHNIEEINVNLTKKERILLNLKRILLNLKGLLKDLFRVTVVGLLALGLIVYLSKTIDVYLFATFYPNEVRNAIVVHNKGEEVKKLFIDEVYSKSIK